MNAAERFCKAYHLRWLASGETDGAHWLKQLRDDAFASFTAQGLPGSREENWKYTRLNKIEKPEFGLFEQSDFSGQSTSLLAAIQPGDLTLLSDVHRLVFVNGKYQHALSEWGPLPEGLILCRLSEAMKTYPDVLRPHLGNIADSSAHPFAALNTMFMDDGIFLRVPQNSHISTPIYCLFITVGTERPMISFPRLLVVLEQQSEVSLIEHYLNVESLAGNQNHSHDFINAVTEIELSPDSRLQHYTLQTAATCESHFHGLHVNQQRASQFSSHHVTLGGALTRNDIQIRLIDEQAECRLNGAYCIDGAQHVDYHTRIDHLAPNCRSQELYKGVVQGKSRAVFHGDIVVHQDAQHSDAQLVNKNLLLSQEAEVDTKPELQIYADDVKCSHGAAVGQLDPMALFYLRSRGIPPEQAKTLLVMAFIDEIQQTIATKAAQQLFRPWMQAKLNALMGS
ncbi:Fe-S cluster assembly protein SufD [Photobacterium sagamiensis]|uniref:Fe-S cluster assembly protein SufD n=1 Tax=Photobacterium sagamiensis TaxID=2910241 RepID=UPI003D0F8322